MSSTRKTAVLSLLCALAAAGLAADEGRIEIGPTTTFPIVVSGPGSYILTTDLEVVDEDVNAIEISNPRDVTLDLGGHAIRGPGAGTGNGITILGGRDVRNVRVRNGIVTDFYWGVQLTSTWTYGGNILEDISASDNLGIGIYARHAVVVRCNAYDNGDDGISTSNSVIRDCVSNSNGGDGIVSRRGVVSGCTANWNEGDGISLESSSNQVVFCSVGENTGFGIDMYADAQNNVSHCSGKDNDAGNINNCFAGNGCHHNQLP